MNTICLYRLIIRTSLLCFLLSAILQGCATPPGSVLNLRPVESHNKNIAIFIDKPFTFSRNKQLMTWPDGIYRIKYQDDDGFYFVPPRRIELSPFSFGDRVSTGGLYVRKGDAAIMAWVEELDMFLWLPTFNLVILNIPVDVEYKFINLDGGATIPQKDIPALLAPRQVQE